MKGKKHTAEQIVRKLRQVDVDLAKDSTVEIICRKIGITEQTYYRSRREYGGMRVDQLTRLKELERENARLKKIVAEQTMDIDALKGIASKNGRPVKPAAGD